MKITGTFLESKVAQRIALLLFIAAVIPTMLMVFLSSNKINQIMSNYEHQLLLEKTRNFALHTFSNLMYAKNNFHLIRNNETSKASKFQIASKNIPIFVNVLEVKDSEINNNPLLNQKIDHDLLSLNKTDKVSILVKQHESNSQLLPTIFLGRVDRQAGKEPRYVLAELSSTFLWGAINEYPSDLNMCAYHLNHNVKQAIFCSSQQNIIEAKNIDHDVINHAEWELFLNGEFLSDPWIFDVKRIQPLTQNHLKEFVGSRAFISIAIGSLLAVGLLSLIQIRRTMKPLEHLVSSTEKIKSGDFSPVKIEGDSEFSALGSAFNSMSAHIKTQFATIQAYSAIDREIVSGNDVHQIIQLVLDRLQEISPEQIFCVAEIKEQTSTDAQCDCTIVINGSPINLRLAISTKELSSISQYQHGLFTLVSMESLHTHERLMAEFSTKYLWTLPIFWQGELYGFMCVGRDTPFNQQEDYWQEYQELANRIGTAIASHAREQQLVHEAQYDSLTGLPNRVLLRDRLKLAMEYSNKTGKAMWVVFIDLDRFKVINDSMGHATGDALLKEVAKRLLAQTRETDTVARFGGDEFVLVLSGDAGENIQISVLERMMEAIAEPFNINQHELINTCSIGIAVYPDDGIDAEVLIKNADIAMYRAKELGRNNYQFFTQSLNEKAARRMQLISQLRRAIEQDEFHLVYQPKVDIQSGKIVGLETLIRWEQSDGSFISPNEFVPIAEESGLINSIGEWTFKKACEQAATWFKLGFNDLLVSINLSAKQFEQTGLVAKLQSTLIATGAKASSIELELTETALMHISDTTIKTLYDIKSLGIELSIDDFGTGYSNLSYLNNLPMNTLKIDKAFIDTISLKTGKSPIVDTIISLGKNMDLKVVAEGVETAEQLDYLKVHGCDQMQGYYFSKPLDAEAITSMLLSGKSLNQPKQLKLVKPSKKQQS